MSRIRSGEALALTRRVAGEGDALSLFAALSDGGRRHDVALIERAVGPSLLMAAAAVRIECRGSEAVATALSENGRNLLSVLGEPDGDTLTLTYPRSTSHDAAERLAAPSGFDMLRRLTLSLKSLSEEEPFAIAAPGVIAYDHVDLFEELPPPREDQLGFPDFLFWIAESLIVFEPGAPPRAVCTAFGSDDKDAANRAYHSAADRLGRLVEAASSAPAKAGAQHAPPELGSRFRGNTMGADDAVPDLDDEEYRAVVGRMKAHIAAGDVYQIVPSRTFRASCPDALRTYATLRQLNPSPYQFYVSSPDHLLFGASPETSVRVYDEAQDSRDKVRMCEVKPIAGTRARGASADEDDRLEADMRLDHKELAEHMMLVDLARNDVARVSRPGTRRVAKLMTVERYARVMHLVSSVTGELDPEQDALHALVACLNVGTLTGAPKIRATQLLREEERTKRGPYGGAIGWLTGDGTLDTGVVIRSAVVRDGTAFVRVGAGIVHDSDPQAEADETRKKAAALLTAIAMTAEPERVGEPA